jgi:redox-sensitive bicupin YhaK (pirin superfamily)
MSWQQAVEPECRERHGPVQLVIEPRERDLGGFSVRRVLPSPLRQRVGPFIFFDEMGPAQLAPGRGIDVRPHPHIGLSTVTFLFEGEIVHRDSLGYVQPIRPGAVNLMTAGRGVVHSERTGPDVRAAGSRLHGIQTWMALPDGREEIDPDFEHHPDGSLPEVQVGGAQVRLILGEAFGARSPVRVHLPTLYAEIRLPAGASLPLPAAPELGAYLVAGSARIGDTALAPHTLAILEAGCRTPVVATAASHLLLIGGAPVSERHVWWNFVSSSRERIAQAGRDWEAHRFDPVPGETERIPLPSDQGPRGTSTHA